MGSRIQQFQQTAGKDLQQKELDLYKPILEKAQAAIQKVAKAKGFQYVLDSTTGSGVLVADGTDLLADVKKELGF
jgi:outer membrane protein